MKPAFRLHLELIDDDGSIKRQIIEHRKRCKRHKLKHKQKHKHKHKRKHSKEIQQRVKDNIDRKITVNKDIHKKINKKGVNKENKLLSKRNIFNVLNYFIFENQCDINMKVTVDYFQHW